MSNVMTFEDSVKQRIKSIVSDLIPEERWDQIVNNTINDFEKNDLPKLIKEELTAKYKTAISNELCKSGWQSKISNGNLVASDKINQMLIDAAPVILASMIGNVSQQVLNQFQNSISNYRSY